MTFAINIKFQTCLRFPIFRQGKVEWNLSSFGNINQSDFLSTTICSPQQHGNPFENGTTLFSICYLDHSIQNEFQCKGWHSFIHLFEPQPSTQGGPNSCDAFNLLWSQLSDAKQNAIVAEPIRASKGHFCCLSLYHFSFGAQSIFIGNMSYA